MRHSTGKPTKADEARFIAIKEDGCLCCRIDANRYVEPDIHHLKSGNIRRGHQYTIGLCCWHHRGWPVEPSYFPTDPGPSLADGSRTFHEHYGSDDFLLQLQDIRLDNLREAA
jgi:hypothetical protein